MYHIETRLGSFRFVLTTNKEMYDFNLLDFESIIEKLHDVPVKVKDPKIQKLCFGWTEKLEEYNFFISKENDDALYFNIKTDNKPKYLIIKDSDLENPISLKGFGNRYSKEFLDVVKKNVTRQEEACIITPVEDVVEEIIGNLCSGGILRRIFQDHTDEIFMNDSDHEVFLDYINEYLIKKYER